MELFHSDVEDSNFFAGIFDTRDGNPLSIITSEKVASDQGSAAGPTLIPNEEWMAREILGEGLATEELDDWLTAAVDALLKDNSAETRQQVVRLFSNRHLQHERHEVRPQVLRQCADAGMKEPYHFYLPLLEIKGSVLPILNERGERSGSSNFEPSVAEEFAREIVEQFAPDDPHVKEIAKKFPKGSDQIPYLRKWLQERAVASKK